MSPGTPVTRSHQCGRWRRVLVLAILHLAGNLVEYALPPPQLSRFQLLLLLWLLGPLAWLDLGLAAW